MLQIRTQPEIPPENVVVVAVKAEREISKSALGWALTHVVRPGDFVTLLAVVSGKDKGWRRKLWSFPRLAVGCGGGWREASWEDEKRCEVSASCSQMALQFDGVGGQSKVNMRIKVVVSPEGAAASSTGVVAAESKRVGANWIVLDKQLKQEARQCLAELQSNVVQINRSNAKLLRLNLGELHKPNPPATPTELQGKKIPENRLKHLTPISSPKDSKNSFEASTSSSGTSTCNFSERGRKHLFFEGPHSSVRLRSKEENASSDARFVNSYGSDSDGLTPLPPNLNPKEGYIDFSSPDFQRSHHNMYSHHAPALSAASYAHEAYWIPKDDQVHEQPPPIQNCKPSHETEPPITTRTLQEEFAESDRKSPTGWPDHGGIHANGFSYDSDVREAVSLSSNSPSVPPPLCSICRHKTPMFGKPPRWFSHGELEEATDWFSRENFLAEGGFGWVHRGMLRDGQVVAVKRLKAASLKEDEEFREDVEVLSKAQHRNVVMLVGYCVEGMTRMVVYEYVCNSSLDTHLHGSKRPPLDLPARAKIAVGVARGLRYLHEDCRLGFVHGDLRPNNILLTHDFEPLVGDFGLARWQKEGSLAMDSRLIGTFGYLAPEYIESGAITEKTDVYAFGVVLLELITGRRAVDMTRPKGQQFLAEWARPLLALASGEGRSVAIDRFLDPRLNRDQSRFFPHQLHAMAHSASLCLRRDPQCRPGMSKVLRLLEEDTVIDLGFNLQMRNERHIDHPILQQHTGPRGSYSHRFSSDVVTHALCAERSLQQHTRRRGSHSHRFSNENVSTVLYAERNREKPDQEY